MKDSHDRRQVNKYDKIIRENLEQTLPVIIKDVLQLDIIKSEEIPDEIQHTKERKPDVLKKVTDTRSETFILHLEFQVPNEKDMVYRMAEYSIMLMRKYSIPIKQFVIFLNVAKTRMATAIDTFNHKYHYQLVRFAEVNYKLFLRSSSPEVKMLGILANLDEDDPKKAIYGIVNEINMATVSHLEKEKYFKQLRIFVQLRTNIEHHLEEAMQSVSTFFKEENDIFYRKGANKKTLVFVTNLLLKFNFSDEKAAEAAEVSIDYVRDVRAGLNTENK